MDEKINAVLDSYHELIRKERDSPRAVVAPGEQDQRMRAVGPATGQFINILVKSLEAPTILELGTCVKPGITSVPLPVGAGLEVSRFDVV